MTVTLPITVSNLYTVDVQSPGSFTQGIQLAVLSLMKLRALLIRPSLIMCLFVSVVGLGDEVMELKEKKPALLNYNLDLQALEAFRRQIKEAEIRQFQDSYEGSYFPGGLNSKISSKGKLIPIKREPRHWSTESADTYVQEFLVSHQDKPLAKKNKPIGEYTFIRELDEMPSELRGRSVKALWDSVSFEDLNQNRIVWSVLKRVDSKQLAAKLEEQFLATSDKSRQDSFIGLYTELEMSPSASGLGKLLALDNFKPSSSTRGWALSELGERALPDNKQTNEAISLLKKVSGEDPALKHQALLYWARAASSQALGLAKENWDKLLALEPNAHIPASNLLEVYDGLLRNMKGAVPLESDPERAKQIGARLGNLLHDHGDQLQITEPTEKVKALRQVFQGAASEVATEAFRGAFEPNDGKDHCKLACDLAGQVSNWAKSEFMNGPGSRGAWANSSASAWKFGVSSLAALFLVKAQSRCEGLKAEDTTKNEGVRESIRSGLAAIALQANKEVPPEMAKSNPLTTYGNIFYSLYLDELVNNQSPALKKVGDPNLRSHQQELARTVKNLSGNLAQFDEGQHATSKDSVFQSYLMGISNVTAQNSKLPIAHEITDRISAVRNTLKSPCLFPYKSLLDAKDASDGFTEDPAAMAARSVTMSFGIYLQKGSLSKSKMAMDADRKILLETLECFSKSGWMSSVQLNASGYHSKLPGGIGSHFLYPNLPYITGAIAELKRDPDLTEEELQKLEESEKPIKRLLTGLFKNDGQLRRAGSGKFEDRSPAYVAPLGGLALLNYCPVKKGVDRATILSHLPLPFGDRVLSTGGPMKRVTH